MKTTLEGKQLFYLSGIVQLRNRVAEIYPKKSSEYKVIDVVLLRRKRRRLKSCKDAATSRQKQSRAIKKLEEEILLLKQQNDQKYEQITEKNQIMEEDARAEEMWSNQ